MKIVQTTQRVLAASGQCQCLAKRAYNVRYVARDPKGLLEHEDGFVVAPHQSENPSQAAIDFVEARIQVSDLLKLANGSLIIPSQRTQVRAAFVNNHGERVEFPRLLNFRLGFIEAAQQGQEVYAKPVP